MNILRIPNHFIPLGLLSLFFVSNQYVLIKSLIIFCFLLFFNRSAINKVIDGNFFVLGLFLLFYFVFSVFFLNEKTEVGFQLIFAPIAIYSCGKWFGYSSAHSKSIFYSFFAFGFFISFPVILNVFIDVLSRGFAGGGRNISIDSDGVEKSATVLAGMMIIVAAMSSMGIVAFKEFGWLARCFVFIFFVISVFVSFRLGSRTLLMVMLCSMLMYLAQSSMGKNKSNSLLIFAFVFIFGYLFSSFSSDSSDLFLYYQDRVDDEYGVATAGGRVVKWMSSIEMILSNPLGWGVNVIGYSHNFWLDVARNGGWVSFVLILVVTFCAVITFFYSIKRNKFDRFYTGFLLGLGAGYFALFFVEPILDGFLYVFYSFCCLWGMVSSFNSQIGQVSK